MNKLLIFLLAFGLLVASSAALSRPGSCIEDDDDNGGGNGGGEEGGGDDGEGPPEVTEFVRDAPEMKNSLGQLKESCTAQGVIGGFCKFLNEFRNPLSDEHLSKRHPIIEPWYCR